VESAMVFAMAKVPTAVSLHSKNSHGAIPDNGACGFN